MAQKTQANNKNASTKIVHNWIAYLQYVAFGFGSLLVAFGFLYLIGPK